MGTYNVSSLIVLPGHLNGPEWEEGLEVDSMGAVDESPPKSRMEALWPQV